MKKILIVVIPIIVIVGYLGLKIVLSMNADKHVFDDETTMAEKTTELEVNKETIISDGIKIQIETNSDNNDDYVVEPTIEDNNGVIPSQTEETTEQSISYTIIEETTQVSPMMEETTKKKKKKKKKKEPEMTTKKQVGTTKEPESTTKESETRKLASYSEKNDISSSKVSIVRNSVCARFSGSTDSEKSSLAKYMATNKVSNANSTYKQLTNNTKSFSVKTYSAKIDSDSQDDIIDLSQKAANAIGSLSGSYGIGISTTAQTVGYKVYIVVVY